MATNTGFLMIAGLGALLFLGRGGAGKIPDQDNRLAMGQGRGGPTPSAIPAFDIGSYIDGLFRDTATVRVQPKLKLWFPSSVVVTSSGVPGTSKSKPDLITSTTKVQIGGEGGRTITASALAVLRAQQIAKQKFDAAANVFSPLPGDTAELNRIEEARQRKFATDLIAKNRAAQLARNQTVVARTRSQQENIARGLNPDGSRKTLPPGMSLIVSGQPIVVIGGPEVFGSDDQRRVDFTPQYTETFVISGGMDSAGFASEDEQPSVPTIITVHEKTAAYDIGF